MNNVARNKRAHGFSMVEVLVALVVLGVGMLGIASLYVITLRSSSSAISRMQAANLASDIADRIRANRTAGDAYDVDLADPEDNNCIGSDSEACDPADLAANELFDWEQELTATLPGSPEGVVQVTGGALRSYEITITWSEPGEAEPLSYTLRMQI